MVVRKQSNEEKAALDKAYNYLPGGTVGNVYMPKETAFVIKRGKGSHIWDMSGNEFIDYLIGSGPMVLGHSHPKVVTAVKEALEDGSTYFVTSEPAILLAEEIVNAVPCAEKVRFASTGSEATFFAMRAARAYSKKDKILKFEGAFHGSNDYSVMSISGYGMSPDLSKEFPNPTPGSAGIPKALESEVLIAPFNDIETSTAIIEQHHDEIGAVIMETMQRLITPQPGFLEAIREVTKLYDIPLIFDEVVTGFRFSYGGAQQFYGVTPDLCAMGKIVGGGYPLSVIGGRSDIMDYFDQTHLAQGDWVPQLGTLNGNPIAATAGLATLKVLREPDSYSKLFEKGKRLKQTLENLLDDAGISAKVMGEDCVFDVVFTEDEIVNYRSLQNTDAAKSKLFNKTLFDHGIFKSSTKHYISLTLTEEDIDKTIKAYEDAVTQLK